MNVSTESSGISREGIGFQHVSTAIGLTLAAAALVALSSGQDHAPQAGQVRATSPAAVVRHPPSTEMMTYYIVDSWAQAGPVYAQAESNPSFHIVHDDGTGAIDSVLEELNRRLVVSSQQPGQQPALWLVDMRMR